MAPNEVTGEKSEKNTDYLDWEDYFMGLTFLAAKRSRDSTSDAGACIVNEDKCIVSLGYRGMLKGHSDKEFPGVEDRENNEDSTEIFVCHAEFNAILNKAHHNPKGCTIYVGEFPCNACVKLIIESGIKTVVYMTDPDFDEKSRKAAKLMLNVAGVEYRQYIPKTDTIVIDFAASVNGSRSMDQEPPTPVKKRIAIDTP